jgi:predicted small lipoprotein YifL
MSAPVRYSRRMGGPMLIRSLLVLTLAATAVAGCGRRGSLEAPGEAQAVAAPIAGSPSPGAIEPQPARPAAAPERRFLLDPLI